MPCLCRPSIRRCRAVVGLLLVLCASLTAAPAFAWNGLGHKVVADGYEFSFVRSRKAENGSLTNERPPPHRRTPLQ